jgi:peptidoglycan/LPS O-acetylase OafA/YrhL
MNEQRQVHLDSLRGIAAIIVVITHYIGAFFPYATFGQQGSYQQKLPIEAIFFYPPFGLMVAGNFAVCLFFILSGYVLSYRFLGEPRNTKKIIHAILKRPIRLGGVVLFIITLSAFLWHKNLYFNASVSAISTSTPWFSTLWKGNFALDPFLSSASSALFAHAERYNIALWTIQVELYGSILVFLTLLVIGNFKYRSIVFLLFIIIFAKSYYQGFFLGMLIADLIKNRPFPLSTTLKKYLTLFSGVGFICFSSYPHYVNTTFINTIIYKYLPSDEGFEGGYSMLAALLLFSFICLNESAKTCLNLKVFRFLGDISYGVYGIHILVIGSLSSWVFLQLYQEIGYIYSFLITVTSGLVIIILLGQLITKYIDMPCIRLSSFISSKVMDKVTLITQ